MRINSRRKCHYEVKRRKALWLQRREALRPNCKRMQSSESGFFLYKKYGLLLRSLHGNYHTVSPRFTGTEGDDGWYEVGEGWILEGVNGGDSDAGKWISTVQNVSHIYTWYTFIPLKENCLLTPLKWLHHPTAISKNLTSQILRIVWWSVMSSFCKFLLWNLNLHHTIMYTVAARVCAKFEVASSTERKDRAIESSI